MARRKIPTHTITYLPPFDTKGLYVVDRMGMVVAQFQRNERILVGKIGSMWAPETLAMALNTFSLGTVAAMRAALVEIADRAIEVIDDDEGTYRKIVELAQAALAIPSQKEESEAAK